MKSGSTLTFANEMLVYVHLLTRLTGKSKEKIIVKKNDYSLSKIQFSFPVKKFHCISYTDKYASLLKYSKHQKKELASLTANSSEKGLLSDRKQNLPTFVKKWKHGSIHVRK